MTAVTQILASIEQGNPQAAEQLLPLVYAELRKLAAARMAAESQDHTLQPTALVHEAYLRLVDVERHQHWDNRGHFFAAAAEAMRRILVEQARHKRRERHGGGLRRKELLDEQLAAEPGDERILALDEALTKLSQIRPQAAQLVQLRFFAGLSAEEAAHAAGIASRSARRLWVFARAWLRREMESWQDHNS
ncbi:MAG: sigma-70 family RNA polymerase sigma factor [Planctomycetes bacterium]|nr:sigma-70 family RNA polymerase sigma factor [Planctomycetota bacterium]